MLLAELAARYGLRGGHAAAEVLGALRGLLSSMTITDIVQQGMHEFLDMMQLRLTEVGRHLARGFFGHEPEGVQVQLEPAR